jgi:hypothetical protein
MMIKLIGKAFFIRFSMKMKIKFKKRKITQLISLKIHRCVQQHEEARKKLILVRDRAACPFRGIPFAPVGGATLGGESNKPFISFSIDKNYQRAMN